MNNKYEIEYTEFDGGIEIEEFSSEEEIVEIPSIVDGKKVATISFSAIDCDNAKTIILPETLENIEPCNFCAFEQLETIDLSKTKIKVLEEETIADCKKLKRVLLPDTLEEINSAFKNCHIEKLEIPDSVCCIENGFSDCKIDNLILSAAEKISLGKNFHYSNIELTHNDYHEIENNMLFTKNKEKLLSVPDNIEEVILPNETEYVEDYVFCEKKIKKVDINNVDTIGKYCFFDSQIEDLKANKLIKAGKSSFTNLQVKNIELKSLTYLDAWMFKDSKIENIELSDKITTICEFAFAWCDIKSFKCPEKLTVIDRSAFEHSTLESIEFNSKLKEIGANAFLECLKHAKIILPQSLKVINRNAFTYSEDSIYVLPKNMEYIDGIDIGNKTECKNIFLPVLSNEKNAYLSRTNLEMVEISTTKDLSELLDNGFTMKEINTILKKDKGR